MSHRRKCPRCHRHELDPTRYGSVEIDACVYCGGLWFDQGELEQAVGEAIGSSASLIDDLAEVALRKDAEGLACPACAGQLVCYEFPNLGDVDLDVCESCQGVWVDQGELQQVQRGRAQELIDGSITWRSWLFQFLLSLPVEYNLRPRRFPLVTVSLVAINVLLTAVLLLGGGLEPAVMSWGLIPGQLLAGRGLATLLTHAFLHGGLIHLAFNMYFLYILGDNVEDVLGRGGYLLFYLLVAVAGAVTHVAIHPGDATPMVGASGAVSAVMAAYMVFFRHARLTMMFFFIQFKLPTAAYVLFWAAINVFGVLTQRGNIAWGAHLGGFACGLTIALLLDRRIVAKNPILKLLRAKKPADEFRRPISEG